MNCIDKMYKEIEEIIKKEAEEKVKMLNPIKEIKHPFSDDEKEVETPILSVDYLGKISLDGLKFDKKYFDVKKAKTFIEFIFKKYFCFNASNEKTLNFIKDLSKKLENEEDLLSKLTNLQNEFASIINNDEKIEEYFLNPYNALFKDEKGYYAVILNGKFSDVKRPTAYNLNQLKKLVKEEVDQYVEDFQTKLSKKETASILNSLKAEINKNPSQNSQELEKQIEEELFKTLKKYGVSEGEFNDYLENKGIRLVKQGNYYFREKAYNEYANYKKIEFRY